MLGGPFLNPKRVHTFKIGVYPAAILPMLAVYGELLAREQRVLSVFMNRLVSSICGYGSNRRHHCFCGSVPLKGR